MGRQDIDDNSRIPTRERAFAVVQAAFGVCLLSGLLLYVDTAAILRRLAGLDQQWLLIAVLFILTSKAIGAANLYLLVSCTGRIRGLDFVPVYWTGWALGLVVPGQVGDLAGISGMLRRFQFEWHQSLGAGFLDKVITLSITLLLASIGLAGIVHLHSFHAPASAWLVAGTVIGIALAVGCRYVVKIGSRKSPLSWMLGLPRRTVAEIIRTATAHPFIVVLNVLSTTAKIALTAMAYWAMFSALGFSRDVFLIIPLVAASSIIAYIPISVNGIGTVEAAAIVLFSSVGIPEAAVLSAYLTLRGVVLTLAWGPIGLWLLIKRHGNIIRRRDRYDAQKHTDG